MLDQINIDTIVAIAREAGQAIMKIYAKDFEVEYKGDDSPLTEADTKSNEIILARLKTAYPDIPFISEEHKATDYEVRKNWPFFWLIDPIDGTKEFIKKNGEFTVNIALIHNGVPVLGVVDVPAFGHCYYAVKGKGAFKISAEGDITPIKANEHYKTLQNVNVVASRSHLSDEVVKFVDDLKAQGKQVDFVSAGSSLKFCLVAEGAADVYPRLAPTMEWDTGAAHAIVLEAGKQVFRADDRTPLVYNKESLLNPFFIVE